MKMFMLYDWIEFNKIPTYVTIASLKMESDSIYRPNPKNSTRDPPLCKPFPTLSQQK